MKTYMAVYFGSTLLALITTPIVICFARKFNLVDIPSMRKIHSKPIPRIGGLAIFMSAMAFTIPVLFVPNIIGQSFRLVQSKITTLLFAGGLMFLVGLIDDIKKLRVRTKLLVEVIAALIVCNVGIHIKSITLTDSLSINLGWFSWPLTILWIVGITNAINLIDGLDGLAAGICAATCGVIAVLSLLFGPAIMTIMMLSLLGALTGFLFFNFNPAKIFMGDSGSLFLGFTIASCSVMCAAKTETVVGLALPALTLGIPIFDTLLSMLRRFVERRSIFAADRSHFHHRLLALGLRQRHAVITAYLVTLTATGLGMFMLCTRNAQTIVVFVCVLLLLILVFRVVDSVQLCEMIGGLKRKYMISNQTRRERASFEDIQLYFSQAETFDQWWKAVCIAADKLDLVRGLLPITNRDGSKRALTWERSSANIEKNDIVKMSLPVLDRRAGTPLNLEIQIQANGSLESAGRRATLLGRLLEEYSVANL